MPPSAWKKNRMDAPHLREERRKHVEAHGRAADRAQRAAERLLLFTDDGDRLLQILKDPVAQLQQRFARRGNSNAPADAMEDRFAEFLFEQQDLAADRRLRDVE